MNRMTFTCRTCGCTATQALADANTLGFQAELQRGIYTCCQIVAWADEQWSAWMEAAEQDGKLAEAVTKPLEYDNPQEGLVVPFLVARNDCTGTNQLAEFRVFFRLDER